MIFAGRPLEVDFIQRLIFFSLYFGQQETYVHTQLQPVQKINYSWVFNILLEARHIWIYPLRPQKIICWWSIFWLCEEYVVLIKKFRAHRSERVSIEAFVLSACFVVLYLQIIFSISLWIYIISINWQKLSILVIPKSDPSYFPNVCSTFHTVFGGKK